jgi:hypothetical protein
MDETPKNGESSAERIKRRSFKRALAAVDAGTVERVELPDGEPVQLRHPGPLAAWRIANRNDELFAAMRAHTDRRSDAAIAATCEYMDYLTAVLSRLFVDPPFDGGLKPGAIGLSDIDSDDLAQIFKWLRGEVISAADGRPEDLSTFPGKSGGVATPGVGGSGEPLPSQPVAVPDGDAGLPG